MLSMQPSVVDHKRGLINSLSGSQLDSMASQATASLACGQHQGLGARSFSDPPISFDQRALRQRAVIPSSQRPPEQLYSAPRQTGPSPPSSLSEQRGLSSSWTNVVVPPRSASKPTSGYRVYSNAYTAGRSAKSASTQHKQPASSWGAESSMSLGYATAGTPLPQHAAPSGPSTFAGGVSLTPLPARDLPCVAAGRSAAAHASADTYPISRASRPTLVPETSSGAGNRSALSAALHPSRGGELKHAPASWESSDGITRTASNERPPLHDGMTLATLQQRAQSLGSISPLSGSPGQREALLAALARSQQGDSNAIHFAGSQGSSNTEYLLRCLQASTAQQEQQKRTLQALQETLARTERDARAAAQQSADYRVVAGSSLQASAGLDESVDIAALQAAVRAIGKSKSFTMGEAGSLHPRKYRRTTSHSLPVSPTMASWDVNRPNDAPTRVPNGEAAGDLDMAPANEASATSEEPNAELLFLAAETLVAMTGGAEGGADSSRSSCHGSGSDNSDPRSPGGGGPSSLPSAHRRRRSTAQRSSAQQPSPPGLVPHGEARLNRDSSGSASSGLAGAPHPILGLMVPHGRRRN
ncbi:hypothetical protein WJX72_010112 [[Myrmecia] bisecta]|uniref:Uncharacterized protein n=1 Tax=[Myrmecia] bisecta TaxID=41462 RepID=A0AAW1QB95_9CHLO